MRLLVAADLHYTLRQLDWVERVAGDYDLVILGGDELDVASSVPLDAQIKVLLRYVEAIARKSVVLVNSGNHDLNARDADGEKVAAWLPDAKRDGVYVDGDTLSMGDVLFTVCPWWDGPLAQRRVEQQLAADRDQRPGTWTWVYHSPPKGRCRGLASVTSATTCSRGGSNGSRPTSSSPGMCTRPRSPRRGRGPSASAPHGSSTPDVRPRRPPRTSSWTSTRTRRSGGRRSAPGRCV